MDAVMDKSRISMIVNAILSIGTVVALVWGSRYNWPDYVHVRYGFPLTWGIHTLVTIKGPVDIWSVNISSLVMDLAFWLGAMLVVNLYLLWRSTGKD